MSELGFLQYSFIFQIINCFSTATANVLITLFVLCNKRLKKENELIIMGYYCLCDGLYAYSAGYLAIRRLMVALQPEDFPHISQLDCVTNPFMFTLMFAYMTVPLAEINLTVNRIYALFFPLKYLQKTMKSTVTVLAFITSIALLIASFSVWHVSISPVHLISYGCNADAFTPFVGTIMYGGKATLFIICCLIYIPILIKIRMLFRDNNCCKDLRASAKTSLVTGILIAGLLFLVIIPTLTFSIFPPSELLQSVFYNFALSKPWLNILVAILSFSTLRKAIQSIFDGRKRRHTQPIVLIYNGDSKEKRRGTS